MLKYSSKLRRSGWIGLLPALLLGLGVLLSGASAHAEEPYSVETVSAKASAYFPEAVVNQLDPQGFRLVTSSNGLKTTVCEVWWAKAVTAQDKPAMAGLRYGTFQTGAFVGVLHFPAEADPEVREDFHDQKLRPGYFTMRYAPQPQELGEKDSPMRDFVILSPISVDRTPDRVLAMDELLRISKIASRTKDPAVMSLAAADGSHGPGPSVRVDDAGTCIVESVLRTQSEAGTKKDVGVAIVLVTPKQDNDAS